MWAVTHSRQGGVYSLHFWYVTAVLASFIIDRDHFPPGNNYESTFEAEVLDSTRYCQIWGYDYRTKSLGSDIPKSQRGRTHFHRYGLAGVDKHAPSDRPPMYTLESIMKLNGERAVRLFSSYPSTFFQVIHISIS
jgi:hypothetical protein